AFGAAVVFLFGIVVNQILFERGRTGGSLGVALAAAAWRRRCLGRCGLGSLCLPGIVCRYRGCCGDLGFVAAVAAVAASSAAIASAAAAVFGAGVHLGIGAGWRFAVGNGILAVAIVLLTLATARMTAIFTFLFGFGRCTFVAATIASPALATFPTGCGT